MTDPATLKDLSMFLYGCVGGTITFLIAFALPELRAASQANDLHPPGVLKALVILGYALVLIALGGGAAVLLGDATSAKQAVVYGMGAEGILNGLSRTASA